MVIEAFIPLVPFGLDANSKHSGCTPLLYQTNVSHALGVLTTSGKMVSAAPQELVPLPVTITL